MNIGTTRFAALWLTVHAGMLVSSVLLLQSFARNPAPPGATSVLHAQVVDARGATRDVTLPYDARARHDARRRVRFQAAVELGAADPRPEAVLLSSVRMNAAVRVNGARLPIHGRLASPVSRYWTRALPFSVPRDAWRSGNNTLEIEVVAEPSGTAALGVVYAGGQADLAAAAARITLRRHTLVVILVSAMLTVAGLFGAVWLLRRRESLYGLYAGGMATWALHDLNFIVAAPPLPTLYWDALAALALGGFVGFTLFFIHRVMDKRLPRVERAVLLGLFVGGATMLLLPEPLAARFIASCWNPGILGLGLYLNLHLMWEAWRRRSWTLQLLGTAGLPMIIAGARDVRVAVGSMPWDFGYTLHYSAVFPLVAFTALLVARIVRSLETSEALVRDLDARVSEKTAEIAAQEQALRAHAEARRLAEERERIARDMHDGVGGQLIALLARAARAPLEGAETVRSLRRALADLRLIVASLDLPPGDLQSALATFRTRTEERLRGTGFTLTWRVRALPSLGDWFGASQVLDLLRLMEEAITNALRHSGGHQIRISACEHAGEVEIVIEDDGGGMRDTGVGRGLANMRARAARLQGTLEITSREDGTCVRFVMHSAQASPVSQEHGMRGPQGDA